jgi:hypothetical protein
MVGFCPVYRGWRRLDWAGGHTKCSTTDKRSKYFILRISHPALVQFLSSGFGCPSEIEYTCPTFKQAYDLLGTNLQLLRDFGWGKVFHQLRGGLPLKSIQLGLEQRLGCPA